MLAQGTKLTVNLNIKGIDVSKNTNVTLNPVKYLKSGPYLSFSGTTEDAIAEAVKEAGFDRLDTLKKNQSSIDNNKKKSL